MLPAAGASWPNGKCTLVEVKLHIPSPQVYRLLSQTPPLRWYVAASGLPGPCDNRSLLDRNSHGGVCVSGFELEFLKLRNV